MQFSQPFNEQGKHADFNMGLNARPLHSLPKNDTLGIVLVSLVMNIEWWRKRIQVNGKGQNAKAWETVVNEDIKFLWHAA